jgi:hypothetical protein
MILSVKLPHHFQDMNMEIEDTEVMIVMFRNLQARKIQQLTHKA